MKSRIIWAVVVLAALAGFYVVTIRPTRYQSPGFSRKRPPLRDLRPPDIAAPPIPQPVIAMPVITPPAMNQPIAVPPVVVKRDERTPSRQIVPIQDGATIDFSRRDPQVIVSGEDQKALDRALKEMAEAVKDVTFEPKK